MCLPFPGPCPPSYTTAAPGLDLLMLKTQETASAAARTILQERWLRIIPTAFVMYTIAYIDRTNISMALPSMSRELHMTPTQAGNAAGIFFWGYLLLQIPGGYLAERWSAKRFVSVLLVAWGICSVACGLVHTARQFWVMRLLLGVTEGGVWPATLVLLAHWFPRAERARANGYWMLCQPAAVILASPLSGWILGHWDWRVLLISEGALPFVWLVVWWRFIDDHPHQARWISAAERDHLESTLLRESAELEPVSPEPFLRTLVRPQVLADGRCLLPAELRRVWLLVLASQRPQEREQRERPAGGIPLCHSLPHHRGMHGSHFPPFRPDR